MNNCLMKIAGPAFGGSTRQYGVAQLVELFGKHQSRRIATFGVLALGFLVWARVLVMIFARGDYYVSKFYMADDAFYYFQIAENIADGLWQYL